MQQLPKNESESLRKEVVFTTSNDQKVIVDIAPLEEFFRDFSYPPPEFAKRVQGIMDTMVLSQPMEGSAFHADIQRDYDLLKHLRDAFCSMSWKEVSNG
jgi:hypothetical protein